MKKIILLTVLCFAYIAILGCSKNQADDYTSNVDCTNVVAATNTYDGSIKTIVDASCAYTGCHSASSAESGVDLSTYAKVKDEFTNGNSLCTIYHDCEAMPKGTAKLSDAIITQITCWVKEGCPQS
jgi:hypothetical protein